MALLKGRVPAAPPNGVRRLRGRPRALRRQAWVAAIGGSALALGVLAPVAPAAAAATAVIVSGGDVAATARQVRAAGGTVTERLPLIGGVAAELPAGAQLPPGYLITPDRAVAFTGTDPAPSATVSTVRATIGLPPTGDQGQGVTVAVVDTGVSDVSDLSGAVVAHLDATGSGPGDGYGHGTFMAGLIAGSGAASGGAYLGVAPGASVLDVKVARNDGSTDLTSVLRGLQLVADQGHRYGVKVLNLSLASGSPVSYQLDPLNQALRALWREGVTVVVPAGNDGPGAGTIEAPGNDPTLLTVGALNEHGTAGRGDDDAAAFSGQGPTSQGIDKPDLAAPGVSLIGLRSPGSIADTEHPQARVGDAYFRGSGSSMATAVTSGVVADLLATNPRLRPDDVKALLRDTAYAEPGLSDPTAAGKGGLDAAAALADAAGWHPSAATPTAGAAPGDPGTWRALAKAFQRGDEAAAQAAWDQLSPQAQSWAAQSWASLGAKTQAWVAQSWVAQSWASADVPIQEWAARSWAAHAWSGDDWAAQSWAAQSWAAQSWAAQSWAAQSWAAQSWAAQSWAAQSWAAQSWAAQSWAGNDWAAQSWAAQSWAAQSWTAIWS